MMWRLESDRGVYAIKQLSADTDLKDADVVRHYNLTETVAETFAAHGVPSVFAVKGSEHYLQLIDGVGYLVYPWTDASALDVEQISARHALEVTGVMARMHRANVSVPGLKEAKFDVHPEHKVIDLVGRVQQAGARSARELAAGLPSFLELLHRQINAIGILEQHLVVSHGDLDHKNVLWDAAGNLLLIDWESARRLNPTYEIVMEALDWSGITRSFDHSLYEKMIAAYIRAGGTMESDTLQACFDCILGDWTNWLMYNASRAVDMEQAEQRAIGANQVDLALSTLARLQRQLPQLLSITRSCAVNGSPVILSN